MARAINPMVERPYILEDERKLPADKQTTWWVLPLSTSVQVRTSDNLITQLNAGTDESEMRYRTGQQMVEILMYSLVRVSNFLDDDGDEIPVPVPADRKNMKPHEKADKMVFLDRMEPGWRTEIGMAVSNWSKLSEKDAKNSDALSPCVSSSETEGAEATVPNGRNALAS